MKKINTIRTHIVELSDADIKYLLGGLAALYPVIEDDPEKWGDATAARTEAGELYDVLRAL